MRLREGGFKLRRFGEVSHSFSVSNEVSPWVHTFDFPLFRSNTHLQVIPGSRLFRVSCFSALPSRSTRAHDLEIFERLRFRRDPLRLNFPRPLCTLVSTPTRFRFDSSLAFVPAFPTRIRVLVQTRPSTTSGCTVARVVVEAFTLVLATEFHCTSPRLTGARV